MKARAASWAVGLLLVVILNEAQATRSNGTSVHICHLQFNIHSETQGLSEKTSMKTTPVASQIRIKEDEKHMEYKPSKTLSRHEEGQNWLPDITYERDSLQFTTMHKKNEWPRAHIKVCSHVRLQSTNKAISRLDSRVTNMKTKSRNRFISGVETREYNFKNEFRNEVRDGFERYDIRRESGSEDRTRSDKRMTQLKRESKTQVRDHSQTFDSKVDHRTEARSRLHRRMADYKREFRFQGSYDFVRPYSRRDSRSEVRSNIDRRTVGLKRDSRNLVRNVFKRSNSMRKSRNEGRGNLDRRMIDLEQDFRFRVTDGSGRPDVWKEFRVQGRSRLNRRMVDLKSDARNQIRDGSARSDSRRITRSEGRNILGRRLADLKKEFRNQVKDASQRSRRKLRHNSRSRFEKTENEFIRKLKLGFTRNIRNKIRSIPIVKVENSIRGKSQFLNRTEWIGLGFRKEFLDDVRVGTSQILEPRIGKTSRWSTNGKKPKRLINRGAGDKMDKIRKHRAEANKTMDTGSQQKITLGPMKTEISWYGSESWTSKAKEGINYFRKSHENLEDSKMATSSDEVSLTFNSFHLRFPLMHNSHLQDMSLEYLQNQTNHHSERCVQATDKPLRNCSSGISILSLNQHKLEGWFRKDDAYDYPLLAVSLLSIGAPSLITSARQMVAS